MLKSNGWTIDGAATIFTGAGLLLSGAAITILAACRAPIPDALTALAGATASTLAYLLGHHAAARKEAPPAGAPAGPKEPTSIVPSEGTPSFSGKG